MQQDQYLPCEAYENQAIHPEFKDFAAFQDAASKEFYFAMLDAKGKVVLKSEGYPLEKSRETGLKSVIKNRAKQDFFSVKEENGAFFVSLRAGNHREIARSCNFKTAKAAEATLTGLFTVKAEKAPAKKAEKATKVVAKKATPATPAKAAKVEKVVAKKATTKTVAKKAAPAKAAKVEKVAAKKVATKKVAAKTTSKKVAAKTATPVVDVKAFEVTKTYVEGSMVRPTTLASAEVKSYLNLDSYYGHPTLNDEYGPTGYATFQANDQHFFVVYNPDRSVYLRSQGFASAKNCNEVLGSVQENIVNPEQYQVREIGNNFAVVLMDAAQIEIARSAEFTSFTEAFRSTPKGRVRNEDVVLY